MAPNGECGRGGSQWIIGDDTISGDGQCWVHILSASKVGIWTACKFRMGITLSVVVFVGVQSSCLFACSVARWVVESHGRTGICGRTNG